MKYGLRLGSWSVPRIRLYPTLLKAVRELGRLEEGKEGLEVLARGMGHSSLRSGTLLQKIAALRDYGLLEGRGEGIRLSELGRRLAAADGKEALELYKEALLNIPLWRLLYNRFGLDLPSNEEVAHALVEFTGCSLEEAREKADEIKREFYKDFEYLTKASRGIEIDRRGRSVEREGEVTPLMAKMATLSEQNIVELRLGYIRIQLRPLPEDIEIARSLLNLLERKLGFRSSGAQI